LWLARSALQSNNFDDALSIYRAVLSTSSTPPPTNMLMQISGDLGNAGRLVEILQEVGPHFDAQAHGLTVGNNLMKAYVQLGDFAAAKLILDELYALKRMDWKPTLAYWETEIAKSRIAANRVAEQGPLNIGLAGIDGPVWLRSSSPALKLFPVKSPEVPVIAFLGSSAETTNTSKNIQPQMADGPGRMSRALPLCLAEHVYFHSLARVLTLVPRVAGLDGGFVLSGVPWPDKDAAKYGVTGPIECLYVVLSHIDTRTEPWTVELRLIRTSDGECVRSIVVPLTHTEPEPAVRELTNRLMASLFEFARLDTIEAPPAYDIPTADQFSYYLLRLEQLLAVVCAAPDGVESRALSGEREIIDGNILLCLGSPASVTARIMLAQTLLSMKHVRPEVVAEYKDKVALLQKEKHLPDSASNTIVQRIFDEAFTPADPSVSA